MAPPVAIVTGGSSGIGLALTRYLIERNWDVVIADLNPPPETLDASRIKYIQTDVASWDSQAAMFASAYAWHGRLDFCALNAGMADKDDIFFTLSHDAAKGPVRPNMMAFEVNLLAPYYGLKLGSHYMTIDSAAAGKLKTGGKFVLTSSGAGIFPLLSAPQYCAAKHGIVGLVRSAGLLPDGAKAQNITINAVCPGVIDTNILPRQFYKDLTAKFVTPMSTIMRCFEELGLLSDGAKEDWVERGPSGQTVEGNMENLVWHTPPDLPGRNPEDLAHVSATLIASMRPGIVEATRLNEAQSAS